MIPIPPRFALRRLFMVLALTIIVIVMLAAPLSSTVAAPPDDSASAPADHARLVVLIVVDQLRADLVTRFADQSEDGGFRRLMREGAFYANAYFSHGTTATAPGHAAIITGRSPRRHGIVSNAWLDSISGKLTASIDDDDFELLGVDQPGHGRSPRRLLAPAFGDQLKLSDARSRVYSVALKDRAAILLGGHNPNAALWWDTSTGRFITSTYYDDSLPACAAAFNQERWADRFFGMTWDRALPEPAYARTWPNAAGRLPATGGLGAVFPHALASTANKPNADFYKSILASPFGNDVCLEMARRLIVDEKLGQSDAIDLLCIGLSSNDVCGHYFGPESPEVMDMTVRTDRQLAALFDLLDRQIGLPRCLIALTADHGVTTPPPVAQAAKLGGGYIDLDAAIKRINAVMAARFGARASDSGFLLDHELPWVFFRPGALPDAEEPRRVMLDFAAAQLGALEGAEAVYSSIDLAGPPPSRDDLPRWLAWRSFHPGRSGDLYLQLASYWYTKEDKLAGHTAASTHDRHVPILLIGPGVRPGRNLQAADPCDISVTLSALLGVEPPLSAEGAILPGIAE